MICLYLSAWKILRTGKQLYNILPLLCGGGLLELGECQKSGSAEAIFGRLVSTSCLLQRMRGDGHAGKVQLLLCFSPMGRGRREQPSLHEAKQTLLVTDILTPVGPESSHVGAPWLSVPSVHTSLADHSSRR